MNTDSLHEITAGVCFEAFDGVCCASMRPTLREIQEQNDYLQRRQDEFRVAARYVSERLALLDCVRKIAIIGSVAMPLEKEVPRFRAYRRHGIELLHECSDLDLAVWISDLSDLKALQKCRSGALNDLARERGVTFAHHQVEVFLLEPNTDRHLGRLCIFGQCPRGKAECRVPGCGEKPFLRQLSDFDFHRQTLSPGKFIVLFDRDGAPRSA